MIRRIWRGYARPENADAFEHHLQALVFPAVIGMRPPGLKGMELLRRQAGDEIEFIWMMNFETGRAATPRPEDVEPMSVPFAAQRLLVRWDEKPSFYEVRPLEN